MTLGKDLSPLFQSVIKCLEYQDLDIKKLVTNPYYLGLPIHHQLLSGSP
jgi:vesicle coat complex subunit